MTKLILTLVIMMIVGYQLYDFVSSTRTTIQNYNAKINAAIEGSQK